MWSQHRLLCLAFAAVACLPASVLAQASSSIDLGSFKSGWWGRTSLGLAVSHADARMACNTTSGCEEVSLTGKATLGDSFGVFGRVGSTYPKTYALGNDTGYGLSYGAGVSWDFSPRASATLGWEAYDLRTGGPLVRATSLGLQWRY